MKPCFSHDEFKASLAVICIVTFLIVIALALVIR